MTQGLIISVLAVTFGTLAAIVYSLRVLVLMERRIARMDAHIEIITRRIAREELKIEKQEEEILRVLNKSSPKKKSSSKKSSKKQSAKKRKSRK